MSLCIVNAFFLLNEGSIPSGSSRKPRNASALAAALPRLPRLPFALRASCLFHKLLVWSSLHTLLRPQTRVARTGCQPRCRRTRRRPIQLLGSGGCCANPNSDRKKLRRPHSSVITRHTVRNSAPSQRKQKQARCPSAVRPPVSPSRLDPPAVHHKKRVQLVGLVVPHRLLLCQRAAPVDSRQ